MNEGNNNDQKLLSEAEVAERLRISRITVMRARKRGELSFYRIGARVVYAPHHIEQYLASKERRAKCA